MHFGRIIFGFVWRATYAEHRSNSMRIQILISFTESVRFREIEMLTTKLILVHLNAFAVQPIVVETYVDAHLSSFLHLASEKTVWNKNIVFEQTKQIINNVLSDENRNLFAEVWYGWLVRFR